MEARTRVANRMYMRVSASARLGRRLVSEVGESFELVLVDLLDDAAVRRRQDGLFTREVLVKVIHVPFGFLETQNETSTIKCWVIIKRGAEMIVV